MISTKCPSYKTVTYRKRLFYHGGCEQILKHITSKSIIGLTPEVYQKRSRIDKKIKDIIKYRLNG